MSLNNTYRHNILVNGNNYHREVQDIIRTSDSQRELNTCIHEKFGDNRNFVDQNSRNYFYRGGHKR